MKKHVIIFFMAILGVLPLATAQAAKLNCTASLATYDSSNPFNIGGEHKNFEIDLVVDKESQALIGSAEIKFDTFPYVGLIQIEALLPEADEEALAGGLTVHLLNKTTPQKTLGSLAAEITDITNLSLVVLNSEFVNLLLANNINIQDKIQMETILENRSDLFKDGDLLLMEVGSCFYN